MKVAAVLQTGLLGLASLPGTHTHPGAVAVAVRQPKHHHLVQAAIPALVVFHETNGTLGGNSSNIAVCTAPTYDNVSPLRTRISRDDCHDLANKVLRRAGYWEMAQWTGVVATSANDGRDNGTHAGLVSEGTCQFAVARSWDEKLVYDQARDKVFLLASSSSSLSLGPVINNQTASAVAVYVSLHSPFLFCLAYPLWMPFSFPSTTTHPLTRLGKSKKKRKRSS